MSYYEALLFLHILFVAVWFGGGAILLILGARFTRANDTAGLESIFRQASFLSMKVFTPSGLLVLLFGILLVIEGPWTFESLWVVLGLAGYAATFVTGLFILRPHADRIAATIERDRGMTSESAAETARLLQHMRFDYGIIAAVIADMTLKPTADDVGGLIAIAAIIVVGAALAVRGRSPTTVRQEQHQRT